MVSTNNKFNYIVEINEAISGSLELELIVNEIIQKIIAQISAAAAALMIYDPEQKVMSYFVGRGFLEGYNLDEIHEPVKYYVNSWLGQNQELILLIPDEDVSNQPSHIQRFQAEKYHSYIAYPLVVKDRFLGVLEIFISDTPFEIETWKPYIEAVVSILVNAIDRAQHYQEMQHQISELTKAYDLSLVRFVEALERRRENIGQNTQRMADMTSKLAREMGASEDELINIRRGVLLQTFSRLTLPESIINKTESLNEKEWEIIHQHPQIIFDLLEDIDILRPSLEIPYCHHEHWDGSGYPRGLSGENIPLPARQFAVVNVFDALLTERPYRSSWQEEDALAYIRSLSGVQFDPNVVDAFINMFGNEE